MQIATSCNAIIMYNMCNTNYNVLISDTNEIMKQLQDNLYTKDSPPVDLVIRTSGETRLSDFLTFQVSNVYILLCCEY